MLPSHCPSPDMNTEVHWKSVVHPCPPEQSQRLLRPLGAPTYSACSAHLAPHLPVSLAQRTGNLSLEDSRVVGGLKPGLRDRRLKR